MNQEELRKLLSSKKRLDVDDLPEELQILSEVMGKYSAEYAIRYTLYGDEISKLHELLNKIYESGITLDELEDPIREALGLEPLNTGNDLKG